MCEFACLVFGVLLEEGKSKYMQVGKMAKELVSNHKREED